MSYNINVTFELKSGSTTELLMNNYVSAFPTNPTSISESNDDTNPIVLEFAADGVYFGFQKLAPLAVSVEGAAIKSWTTAAPFAYSKLELKNPTADVQVIIKLQIVTDPSKILRPYLIKKTFPIDTRFVVSKQDMLTTSDENQPAVYFAICKDDGQFYLYNKEAEVDEVTGKFRSLVSTLEIPEAEITAITTEEIDDLWTQEENV
jgi:hypothetical protein